LSSINYLLDLAAWFYQLLGAQKASECIKGDYKFHLFLKN
jgi:hypothetical protein